MGPANTGSTISGAFNATNSTASAVFQTVGSGEHYLLPGSPYRSAGTANITAGLRSDLRKRTTSPPIVLSPSYTWWPTNDVRLFPQAQRDTYNQPDLGYHYDPMDYVFANYCVPTNSNIAVVPGTTLGTIGWFYLGPNTKLSANGTVEAPIYFCHYNLIQEDANSYWATPYSYGITQLNIQNTSNPTPQISLNFTRWSVPAGSYFHVLPEGTNSITLRASNSEFYSGWIRGGAGFGTTDPILGLSFTNCLFNCCTIYPSGRDWSVFNIQGCEFYRGVIYFLFPGSNMTLSNSYFDFTGYYNTSTSIVHDYNGYPNSLCQLPTGGGGGTHDVILGTTSMTYTNGTYGRYYQTITNLVDRGSTSATNLGLYHFTTRVPEIKEFGTTVDIGYHYVAAEPSTQGLVGYWRLDEGTGGSTVDTSGNGHNGTLVSGPTWVSGQVGPSALRFDGTNNYVSIPDATSLQLTNDITLALWMRKDAVPSSWVRIFGKASGNLRNYELWQAPASQGNGLEFQQYNWNNSTGLSLDSITATATGQWYHVAITVNGTNGTLYVNGVVDRTGSRNAAPPINSDPVTIGNYSGGCCYFQGAVDDVRLYNRALTASEIVSLAAKTTWDADGDGVPDYLEDANGNGVLDSGETNPLSATDSGFRVLITQPDSRFNIP